MEPSASTIRSAIDELNSVKQVLDRVARALADMGSTGRREERAAPARTPSDRLSSKQLSAIRAGARRGGVSPEQLAQMVAQVSEHATDIVNLDRQEASALIDRLDEITGYGR